MFHTVNGQRCYANHWQGAAYHVLEYLLLELLFREYRLVTVVPETVLQAGGGNLSVVRLVPGWSGEAEQYRRVTAMLSNLLLVLLNTV